MAIAPPRDRAWTVDDLDGMPDDARYEVLEGTLLVSPLERNLNLDAAISLRRQLDPRLPLGWVAEREVGVRLGQDGLVPDVVVLRHPRTAPRNQLGVLPADVALVVEVVSPTSRKRDRLLKPAVYAEAGIPAFWRLELEPQPRLLAYALVAGAYALVADLSVTGTVELLGVTVELDVAGLV